MATSLMNGNRLSPTQQRIMDVLSDGEEHPFEDLLPVLDDGQGSEELLRTHLKDIRKRIGPQGLDVVCRRGKYRLVRFIGQANDGRK